MTNFPIIIILGVEAGGNCHNTPNNLLLHGPINSEPADGKNNVFTLVLLQSQWKTEDDFTEPHVGGQCMPQAMFFL